MTLSTDLYQLTMMAGYYAAGLTGRATFELYVRELPRHRSFLIAAGLEQALDYLANLRFSREDVAYLRQLPALQHVPPSFFDDYLPQVRFTGDVWAVEEGTPVFAREPLLSVTAPLPEAQLVETALLAQIGFQTAVASRAARIVAAAAGRTVVEFGSRRAHGVEAGVLAARAAFIGGCASTSNVEAGRRFGIPVAGTMAHSWVTAFPDELSAFRAYAELFGDGAVLLLDTYDTLAAARMIGPAGLKPRSVRLDSGDLVDLSRRVRSILDESGLIETTIFVSGDLNEWRISEMVESAAPIGGFGVGTALSTSSDAPSVGAVYKLVEIERGGSLVPVMKRSPGKQTFPARKQVWRRFERGTAIEDVIELVTAPDPGPGARPLLKRVMHDGVRVADDGALPHIRDTSRAAVGALPPALRRLHAPVGYPVSVGPALRAALQSNLLQG